MLSLLTNIAVASAITLVTFDGAATTTHKFVELNDPVMGGKSVGTWAINSTGKFGVFDGQVVDVPSLKAPGFIKAAGDGTYPDVSSEILGDLILRVRSSTPEYKGFRVSFAAGTLSPSYACAGGSSIPLSGGCYKNKFNVTGTDWVDVRIPFNTFSDHWSPATGEQTKTCAVDASVCPTRADLAGIKRIEIWAEGALGKVHLEVQSISTGPRAGLLQAMDSGSRPPADQDSCKGPIQNNLKFGIAGRTTAAGVPVNVDPKETLATAVCCDKRVQVFAEPQFLFQAPDINLFTKVDAKGVTTFYDSQCGVPLFRAPVNRTFADFKQDTNEHGWPSFRTSEVFTENVRTDEKTTFVTSVCGTHLGSYLPDSKGSRWCIDLSCISGNKAN